MLDKKPATTNSSITKLLEPRGRLGEAIQIPSVVGDLAQ